LRIISHVLQLGCVGAETASSTARPEAFDGAGNSRMDPRVTVVAVSTLRRTIIVASSLAGENQPRTVRSWQGSLGPWMSRALHQQVSAW
jgi:hypothetical protein